MNAKTGIGVRIRLYDHNKPYTCYPQIILILQLFSIVEVTRIG